MVTSSDPWRGRSAPRLEHVPTLAKMMRTDEATLRAWITREWYGIDLPEFSDRVKGLAPALDALTDEAAATVAALLLLLPREKEEEVDEDD